MFSPPLKKTIQTVETNPSDLQQLRTGEYCRNVKEKRQDTFLFPSDLHGKSMNQNIIGISNSANKILKEQVLVWSQMENNISQERRD